MGKTLFTSSTVGLRNEKLIIELLRKYGPISRQRICEAIGLSNSTASDIFRRLRKKGLILETKGISNTRGAKPIIIKINPKGGYVAGIMIHPSNIFIGLFSLDLETIDIIKIHVKEIPTPHNISNLLQKHLFKLMDTHHIPKSKLNALGITLPGLITPDGIVTNSSPLRWNNVPLKKNLSEHFNCPITIHRIVTLKSLFSEFEALYQIWGQRVTLHITLAHGIGADLILDGKIHHGGSGLLGEIGHIVVDPNGPFCGCGNRGCLESLISGPALAKKIKKDIKAGKQTILRNLIKNKDDPISTINKWGRALRKSDDYARALLYFVGENFSKIIAIAITCYDPNVIILSGYVVRQCSNYLVDKIKEKIDTEVCGSEHRDIR
ncbi:MAG: ROK family transcriptional regulator, partial [Planctomycetota bacterium]